MDGKRNNATITEKNMESAAATKIQASFRGYQVRKQLKTKSDIKNSKRSPRRKSSGKLIESGKMMKRDTSELEERSATKIQAGIRGFLVRRRHQKNSKKHD
ncbi:PREDICTED: uncharacterized protein LOC108567936 [Nicrophorus vespilloides]|uniref:Uncharacterized protein LOC108567936 n=1 Tax=Nicrophorus vespilloides TaxID=110193 RepID=A0ABM1NBN7_NICVS|nr:PREDICTED: uncharacterized protein LOC108567936 [Nicrophorus vespilloides]